MLKIRQIRDVASRTAYHTGGAGLEPGEKNVTFLGCGAALAGFRTDTHAITSQALALALDGVAPDGSYLGLRRSPKRRAGWDVCLSPHKSISVAALCLNPELGQKVRGAWADAVAATVAAMESLACHGNGDGRKPSATGNLIVAAFTHFRSRHNDPQLHTHCLLLNATRSLGGAWRGLEPAPIYRCNMLLDAVLQRELARGLLAAGLDVDLDAKGRARLRAVPAKLCDRFSTARRLLDEADSKTAVPSLASIRQRDARRDLLNDRIRPPKTPAPAKLPALVPASQRAAISRACIRHRPPKNARTRVPDAGGLPPAEPTPDELARQVALRARKRSLWPHTKAVFAAIVETSLTPPSLRLSFQALLAAVSWARLRRALAPKNKPQPFRRVVADRRRRTQLRESLLTRRKNERKGPIKSSEQRRRRRYADQNENRTI
jgi:conjugative relaxase-like TrwC/TraI family protein